MTISDKAADAAMRQSVAGARVSTSGMRMTVSNGADGHPAPAVILEPDAHGQAALLLTESLIHMLVERGALTIDEAVEVVETAGEVKHEVAAAAGESDERMQQSLKLLARMQRSLEIDLPEAWSGMRSGD